MLTTGNNWKSESSFTTQLFKKVSAKQLILGLCIYFVLLCISYAAVTPAFEPPDEASHFLYIHNLLVTGQLPILEDRTTVFESQSVQRHHPPLYYLLGAVLISMTTREDVDFYLQPNPRASIGVVTDNNQNAYLHSITPSIGDTALAVWTLRLYSIGLATSTVWCIYRATWLVSDSWFIGLLAACLVVSIPSFVHISASVNNDNLVTFFHAIGIYLALRMWKQRRISWGYIVAFSLILGGVALTKINGLTLLAILYGWFLLGGVLKQFPWRSVFTLIVVSLLSLSLVAGWWYIRNLQLYGDPLALNATLRIWGRGGPPILISLFEAKGVWDSFWFTLGNLNIRGPEWLHNWYLPVITILGISGVIVAVWRRKVQRLDIFFLIITGVIAIIALFIATSRINVSQGRILFPGLIAYIPLLVIGWVALLGRRFAGLLILPLTSAAVVTPMLFLTPAYTPATIVDTLPTSLYPVKVATDSLVIHGYQLSSDTIDIKGQVRLTIFISGSHPDNPYLYVKALHPTTQELLGGVDTYPGMMPTHSLLAGKIYAVPIHFHLDPNKIEAVGNPFQLRLVMGWRVPEECEDTDDRYLMLQATNGLTNSVVVHGPTLIPSPLPKPIPQVRTDIVYSEYIQLSGFTLSSEIMPGEPLNVTLYWQALAPMSDDWSVAIGLLDENSTIVTQADGMPLGYPTSAWQTGTSFTDERSLLIPQEIKAGNYRLYIGWYRLSDGERLQPVGEGVQSSLYIYPLDLKVQ